jgi:hypothetical protein
VAKKKRKPRTPPPPRRPDTGKTASDRAVQAPQVRKKQRDPAAREKTKRYGLYGLAAVVVIGVAAALIAVFATGGSGGTSRAELNVNFKELPGISHGPAPWQAEINNLGQRLPLIGLHGLTQEGTVVHIHQHLDVYVNGRHITVPQGIGIIPSPTLFAELHTHRPDGIMHVESATKRDFSLGEFFAVWGVFVSRKCIGGYCAKPGTPLNFYIDGKKFRGNPVTLVLKEHQEIAIVYGKPPKKIPSTYNFSAQGL